MIVIAKKIRMANFSEAMDERFVINAEFPVSGSCVFMRCFYVDAKIGKKSGNGRLRKWMKLRMILQK